MVIGHNSYFMPVSVAEHYRFSLLFLQLKTAASTVLRAIKYVSTSQTQI